jgi:hypothetical protein
VGAIGVAQCVSEHRLGHAELAQRVGKLQVLRVLKQRGGELEVGDAREEQHPCIVEVATQFGLHVADGPLLQDVAQPGTGSYRHPFDQFHQVLAVLVHIPLGTDVVAVLEHPQTDGVGLALPVLEQLGRLGRAAVVPTRLSCALAHERRLDFEVLIAWPRLMLTTCFMGSGSWWGAHVSACSRPCPLELDLMTCLSCVKSAVLNQAQARAHST